MIDIFEKLLKNYSILEVKNFFLASKIPTNTQGILLKGTSTFNTMEMDYSKPTLYSIGCSFSHKMKLFIPLFRLKK